MTGFKKIAILIVLSSLVAACFTQVSQEGPSESQGRPHELQGGANKWQNTANVPQVNTYVLQGHAHESQGGENESQGGLHESQGGAHESQGGARELQGVTQQTYRRARRQASQASVEWVACDFTALTKVSCRDCNTRVICKPIGGILRPCSPKKPFCSNGVCSAVPSEECI